MWKPSPTPNDVIMHSAKGSTWKKHKYIAIKNGKYIYPGDNKPSNAAKQRAKMKEQSQNMKYDELGEASDAYLKDNGQYGENFKKAEVNAKRHKMPTGASDSARTNYVNQKRTVEKIGHSPAAMLRGVKTENYLKVLKKKADQSSAAAYGFGEKQGAANKRMTDGGDKEAARKASLHRQAQNKADYKADKAIEKAQRKAQQRNMKTSTKGINGTYSYKNDDQSIWGGTKGSNNGYTSADNARKRASHFSNAASNEKHYADNYRNYQNGSRGEANKVRKKAKAYSTASKSASIRAKQWDEYTAKQYKQAIGRYNNRQAAEGDYKENLKSTSKKVKNPTAKKNQRKAALEKAKYKAKRTLNKIIGKSKSTVTDTFTGKKRPASKSGTTINIKQLSKKNKKKK